MVSSEELPTLASLQSPVLGDNDLLRELQAEKPVWRVRTHTGDEAWLVVGYDEIKTLMRDRRLGRTHKDPKNAPRFVSNPIIDMIMSRPDWYYTHEQHMGLRGLLAPHFTRTRMDALERKVERIVEEMADRIASMVPPVDLLPEFAIPLPFRVLCELVGVPEPERDLLGSLLANVHDVGEDGGETAGRDAFMDYLNDLVARKRDEPADDVISGLCAAGVSDDRAAYIACMLLFAGHESVAMAIGNGIARLATDHELRDSLVRNPDTMSDAVEELLRTSIFGGSTQPHYAREDLEIAGVTIREGELVLPDFAIANFDPRSFPEPDHVDFTRSPNQHLTFAHGTWHCIGSPVARMQLRATFAALLTRLPTLRLAVTLDEVNAASRRVNRLAGTLTELPVTW